MRPKISAPLAEFLRRLETRGVGVLANVSPTTGRMSGLAYCVTTASLLRKVSLAKHTLGRT